MTDCYSKATARCANARGYLHDLDEANRLLSSQR